MERYYVRFLRQEDDERVEMTSQQMPLAKAEKEFLWQTMIPETVKVELVSTNDEVVDEWVSALELAAKAESILKQYDIAAEVDTLTEQQAVAVKIEWGDWKHSHRACDMLLTEAGFEKVGEKLTEENGSDCYSSIHYYA